LDLVTPDLVIGLVGYTKSGKSRVAHLLQGHAGFAVFEMSALLRARLANRTSTLSIDELLLEVESARIQKGPAALAEYVARQVQESGSRLAVVAGIRSVEDHRYLRARFPRYRSIFVHVTTELRHEYMRVDAQSIAKSERDFELLDRQGYIEGIRQVVPEVDFILVNEPGFPLTPLEQLHLFLGRVANELSIAIPWAAARIISFGAPVREPGFSVASLLDAHEQVPAADSVLLQQWLEKRVGSGQLRGPIRYIAPVHFRDKGMVISGHFHEEKAEFLLLLRGTMRGYFRRALMPEEDVHKVEIEAGSLVYIDPGWTHEYEAFDGGSAVEFSTTARDVAATDAIEDNFGN
jgi:mannose-6-phosphate isomerase-like protein (cupin superfamily)